MATSNPRARWALIAATLGMLACTVDLNGQCGDDTDCPQDQACRLGGCVVDAPDEDAAEPDASAQDAGQGGADAGEPDAGEVDAGEPDAGEPDASEPDAGEPDAGEPDAGEADAGPTPTFQTPQTIRLPGVTPISHVLIDDVLYIGGAGGALAVVPLVDGVPGVPEIDPINQDRLTLRWANLTGEPALYISNVPLSGMVSRCTFGVDLGCDVLDNIQNDSVNDMTVADLDGNGEDELVTCRPSGIRIVGLGLANEDVTVGPDQTVGAGVPPCVRVVAGRLRPGAADTLVTVVAGTLVGQLLRTFDYDGDGAWRASAFEAMRNVESPLIADLDQDGLDELFATDGNSPLTPVRRVRVDAEHLEFGRGSPLVQTEHGVQSVALTDADSDGQPDFIGVDGRVGTGRVFYQHGDTVRRTPITGLEVRPLGGGQDATVVYGVGHLTLLRPARDPGEPRWPDAMQAELSGTLIAGGFDLDGNHISEFLWATPGPDGAVGLFEWGPNGTWRALADQIEGAALPNTITHTARADMDDDGVEDLILVGASNGTVSTSVIHGAPTRGGALRSVRWPEFNVVAGEVLAVAPHAQKVHVLTRTDAGARVTRLSVGEVEGGTAFEVRDIAVVDDGDGRVLVGCSLDDAGQVYSLPLPLTFDVRSMAAAVGIQCGAVMAISGGGSLDPRLVVVGRSIGAQGPPALSVAERIDGMESIFSADFALQVAAVPAQPALGDLDGDLLPDLAVPTVQVDGPVSAGLHLLRIDAAGNVRHLTERVNHAGPLLRGEGSGLDADAMATAVGDFDGDGHPDLLIVGQRQGMATMWLYPER